MASFTDWLKGITYTLQHNPNCPFPYLLRTPGKTGVLDNNPDMSKTKDIYAYGYTLEEAAVVLCKNKQLSK